MKPELGILCGIIAVVAGCAKPAATPASSAQLTEAQIDVPATTSTLEAPRVGKLQHDVEPSPDVMLDDDDKTPRRSVRRLGGFSGWK